jgi:outer membrane autotransporter protein
VRDNGRFAINRSDAYTFAANISGAGAFEQLGPGTTIFTGTNTYTGGTTISGGVLQIGNGGTGGSLVGDVVDNGIFVINRSDTFTFGDVISGAGAFVQNGAGTTILTGLNTYTGATTANAGALIVNGSIAPSSGLTVNPGTLVGGTGTLPTTTINGGTLSPGNSIGTVTIAGNLMFVGPGTYLVEVSPSAADRTNVSGSAALAGTLQLAPQPGLYRPGQYVLLNANGGVSGTFATMDGLSGFGPGVRARVVYESNDVLLVLDPNAISPFLPVNLTVNQRNVAAALDAGFGAMASPPAFLALFNLPTAAMPRALDQLSGEIGTGAATAGFRAMDQFLGLMLDPFLENRASDSGSAAPALAFAMAPASPVTKAPAQTPFERRWTAWAAGYGAQGSFAGDPAVIGSHDLSASNAGVAGGIDYRLSTNTVIGAAATGSALTWRLDGGLGSGKADAVQGGVYASTRFDRAYISAAASFGRYDASTDRTVTLPGVSDHLLADFTAHSIGGRIESGYRFPVLATAGVTPYGALQVLGFRTPSYGERDAGGLKAFALNYAGGTNTDVRGELGARFDSRSVMFDNAMLILRGRAAWAHEFDRERAIDAVFQALPVAPFTVFGASPAGDAALVSAGAELRLANGLTLSAKFDGEFAGGTQVYGGTGTVRFSW